MNINRNQYSNIVIYKRLYLKEFVLYNKCDHKKEDYLYYNDHY